MVAVVSLGTALLDCGPSRADVTLASDLPQAPKVSATAGALAWSTFDSTTGMWRLMVRRGGVAQTLPVAPRATPFDVDLGEDGHGGLLASYSRCSAPTRSTELPHGWLAWSAYDRTGHDYRLMLRGPNGRATAAPVPPRTVPFDVQLGPRAGGGLIAVYSRCRVEPRLDPRDVLPAPATGRGCRLYRYDIGSQSERAIPGSGSRFLPSVWHGELAFATLQPNGEPALYLGSLNGRSTTRRLTAGPAPGSSGLGPRALVLREGRVAFVWKYRNRSGLHSELRIDVPGARSRLLDSLTSRSGDARELSPAFTAGVLAWARREAGGCSRIEVFGLASHRIDTYLAPNPIEALATNHLAVYNHLASGEALYACGDGHGGATIRLLATRLRELPTQTVQ